MQCLPILDLCLGQLRRLCFLKKVYIWGWSEWVSFKKCGIIIEYMWDWKGRIWLLMMWKVCWCWSGTRSSSSFVVCYSGGLPFFLSLVVNLFLGSEPSYGEHSSSEPRFCKNNLNWCFILWTSILRGFSLLGFSTSYLVLIVWCVECMCFHIIFALINFLVLLVEWKHWRNYLTCQLIHPPSDLPEYSTKSTSKWRARQNVLHFNHLLWFTFV